VSWSNGLAMLIIYLIYTLSHGYSSTYYSKSRPRWPIYRLLRGTHSIDVSKGARRSYEIKSTPKTPLIISTNNPNYDSLEYSHHNTVKPKHSCKSSTERDISRPSYTSFETGKIQSLPTAPAQPTTTIIINHHHKSTSICSPQKQQTTGRVSQETNT